MARDLKVEDALKYLDQVKMAFFDKPHVYKEFLEIMKNVKAKSINTPQVIECVKNLFRGHNQLILSFNMFLPEGEGYKIELTDEEQTFGHPGDLSSSSITETTSLSLDTLLEEKHDSIAATGDLGQHSTVDTNTKSLDQQMQQQYAITYVTTIRNHFANEPDVYRSFLKILHTYQKEQKGIKRVLEGVIQLFADHPDLLLGFTQFLPDAVQEHAKKSLQRAVQESEFRQQMKVHNAARELELNRRRKAWEDEEENKKSEEVESVNVTAVIVREVSDEAKGDATENISTSTYTKHNNHISLQKTNKYSAFMCSSI